MPLLVIGTGCGDVVTHGAKRASSAADDPAVAPKFERPSSVSGTNGSAAPEGGPAEPAQVADASDDAPTDASPLARDGGAMRTAPIGALQNPQLLHHVYEAFARLEEGHAHDDVRILQYGDSHTASDLGTAALRRALQQRFGDGGRGFVSIGKPWKKYVQDGVKTGMTKEVEGARGRLVPGSKQSGIDSYWGLLGAAINASKRGATAWTEATAPAAHIELDYLEHPGGGSFDVFIDGALASHVATSGQKPRSGFRIFDVGETPHKVEVRATGDGDVRVFGMALDRAAVGVVVDALGINGAQIYTPLGWNEEHFAEQLKHRAPELVILAYGTNESLNTTPPAEYERKLVDLLGRIARATPTASCLILGPPDRATEDKTTKEWSTAAKLVEIVESQRRVAQAAGCAFYDQLAAMGGPGTIALWAKEQHPRAMKDRIHLTRDGYVQLAQAFAGDLVRAYSVWRADNGLAPSTVPAPEIAVPPAIPSPSTTPAPSPAPHKAKRRRVTSSRL